MEREENEDEGRRGTREADVDMQDDPSVQRKGRGFDPRSEGQGPKSDGVKDGGKFDVLDASTIANAEEDVARSIEGYIVIVTGIDEEATEEEVVEKFADFGRVQNCHLNLDRRTGYVKGYALLEYERLEEANEAIEACRDGLTLMDKPLKAGFAFVQPPAAARDTPMAAVRGAQARNRSRSPSQR